MDHNEAKRLELVEKYVLGELPEDLRDQFEEHYFDCRECATDVRALATFMTASRMALEESVPEEPPVPARPPKGPGWFAWLRPVIAVPAIAALAAVLVFQNVVTIPGLKSQLGSAGQGQVYESSYRLMGATRGEGLSNIVIHPNESFVLDFDFTPSHNFSSYRGSLLERSGNTVLSFGITGEKANKELHIFIPGDKVRPGSYELVIVGEGGALRPQPQGNEVQRISFTIAF